MAPISRSLIPLRFTKLRAKVDNPPLLGFISLVTIGYLAYYIWWRATETLNPNALLFSWILLVAEAFGVVNYLLFVWMTRNVAPAKPHVKPRPGLKVDIFVPTFNEDLEVLEATLIGCQKITYPHTTFVLDDGHRPEVEDLARRLRCEYLTRPDRKYAKAGNINHGLKVTSGEFVVILDADMVPQPDFIHRTLGYFEDEKLAFVQMPQEFYNQDSIQHDHKRGTWHEQSLFFRVIQPGKNYTNSAFWTGSPSIMRRKALEDIGGVAEETVTEDIHTSVRLHSNGWNSLFLNEVLAYGIAPQTIYAFLLQRLRWAQGTMQLYRSSDSPVWKPGLTLKQRVSYLASFLAYVESIQKVLLISTPTIIILFEVFPMNVNGFQFFLHWLPYFAFTILANKVSGRGYFNYFQSEKFNLLKMIIFLQSFLVLLWPKKLAFKVTPKSVELGVYQKERAALRLYMVLFGGIIGVSFAGIIHLLNGLSSRMDPSHYAVAIVWATFNAGIILLGIRDVLTQKHSRKHYRFPFKSAGQILSVSENVLIPVVIEDISLNGASFLVNAKENFPDSQLSLYFETPTHEYLVLPLRKCRRHRLWWGPLSQVGAEFEDIETSARKRLFELLYVSLPGALPNRGYEPVSTSQKEENFAITSRHPVDLLDPSSPFRNRSGKLSLAQIRQR